MDHLHYTANEHRKGQHLTFECRVLIQTRLKDGWSPNRIAKEIGCAPNTGWTLRGRTGQDLFLCDLMDYLAGNVQLVIAIFVNIKNNSISYANLIVKNDVQKSRFLNII